MPSAINLPLSLDMTRGRVPSYVSPLTGCWYDSGTNADSLGWLHALEFQLLEPIPGTLASMGLLSPIYGQVLRHVPCLRLGQLTLGAPCGLAAVFAMGQGTHMGGWVADLRSVPVTLAAAYLSR